MLRKSYLTFLGFLVFCGSFALGQESGKADRTTTRQPRISLQSDFRDGKHIVGEVTFSGLDIDQSQYGVGQLYPAYEADFLKQLHKHGAQIRPNSLLDLDRVEGVLIQLKSWLDANGYPYADVTVYGESIGKETIKLNFSVRRNELVKLSRIEFTGNRATPSELLVENLKECSNYDFEVYIPIRLEHYLNRCTLQFLFSQGFLKAKVLSFKRKFIGTTQIAMVALDEGERYRIGKLNVHGEEKISEKTILDWLGSKEGDIADGPKLADFVYKTLKEKYGELGYINFNGEFDVEYVPPIAEGMDGIVNITLLIEEDRLYRVGRIEFVGIPREEANDLIRDFDLKEGEVFVASKLAKGIERINGLNRYEPIDKEGDVELLMEITTDQDEGIADVRIVTRKLLQMR